MRAFLDILRFELRLHLRSPLFIGIALLFFALNFLTQTRTGINLGDNELIALNSAWLIFQTQLVLGVFGMLPALIFAVTAITRDHERNTLELFFTTPVPRTAFVLGRFSAGTLAAMLIALVGILGALTGSFMPWLDPARITAFDWRPWVVCFLVLVLPNVVVFCALFFCVGALTRSTAMTFGAALGVLVLEIFVNTSATAPITQWLLIADPFGGLAIAEASRYWTVSELNTLLPTALLLPNRLFWLFAAASVLALTCRSFRMELVGGVLPVLRRVGAVATPAPAVSGIAPYLRFDFGGDLQQFMSQLRMDWRGVWSSPLFWIVLVLAALATFTDSTNRVSSLANLPLYPSTTLMLGFFRFGLFQYVLLLVIWYSAALVHRERDSAVDGMSGAAPCADWVPVASKTLVLCGIILLLLLVSMAASVAVQLAAGFTRLEIGLYLQGLFIYNGFYFCMQCVLAMLIQVLSPGKWSGMVFTLIAFVALASLSSFGLEHQLYSFQIPSVVHSDMNGFGHYKVQTYTLIAYWGAFCVLLLVAGHLLFPRGYYASFSERLHDARTRVTASVLRVAGVAFVVFAAAGSFVFYNTNVLNEYVTREATFAARAHYELDYGRYRDVPAPSMINPDVRVEIYPTERRLESRGTAGLINDTGSDLGEFVISSDRLNRVAELRIDGATLVQSNPAQGFYLFRPDARFAPGATLTMQWTLIRERKGFPNANADDFLVANGTYLRGHIPLPGYCTDCELSFLRERYGLPPAARLPALGDPEHLDRAFPGITLRSPMHIVIGTDADQTAVAPGALRRSWEESGRRHFEYALDTPTWPMMALMSARYTVARADWNGVNIEVYHDAKHPWNIPVMLSTAQKGLEYYSREFGPYILPYYRMVEYPRYQSNVQAGVGMIAYSEISGFMTDLRGWADLDYATLHELAHQWWGNVYGARMQGRQFLNEGLAQYSTFMMYKEYADPVWLRQVLAVTHDGYLNGRSADTVAEQPVLLTEDQGHISYNKAALGLFALQELIGADKVNGALRAYYERFLPMRPPLPTSRDLIEELRKVAGPDYQRFITDYFEKVMLHDVQVTAASVQPVGNEYEVTLDIDARQFEADGQGNETEVALDTWFEIVVFPESTQPLLAQTPLYQQQHRLHTGSQRVTVRVPQAPGNVGVDPFHLMIDRKTANNLREL